MEKKYEEDNVEYNDVPVVYCKNCLSLRIMSLGGTEFCDVCGASTVDSTHIHTWENMYKEKYGELLIKKSNGRERS